ncbi:MAG: glycosyltransferase family 2 protein [Alistipes sp.]|nr:glycosyltransferase family 2 protein [Alistipes sp.]
MKLSIIIISYNTKEILDNCIASIKSSCIRHSYEIIVVDNASHDGSVDMLEQKHSDIKLIKNKENKLFAIANNQGAKIATGEYLFLLNSDTLVYDTNIDRLIDYFDTLSDQIICIGPKILNFDKTLQSQGMHGFSLWGTFCSYFKIEKILPGFIGKILLPPATYCWNCNQPHEVGWVSGCAMMIRRKEYMALGGLNEKLEFYGEEPEFSYRAKKNGYSTYYNPYVEIIHLGGYSTPRKTNIKEQQEISLRRYTKLIELTTGYKYGIFTSMIVLLSCYCKLPFVRNKNVLKERIINDRKVISHFYRLLRERNS